MKILFLLFSLLLLLVQGAAGKEFECRRKGGFCTSGVCPYPTAAIGSCPSFRTCCRR
uniref:Beta-defensin 131 n=1 Tax=Garrulax canorus TaxID=238855 RepID=A0A3G1AZT4_9PASS|nr:beta-defensin 131 [Garrulax canorus]